MRYADELVTEIIDWGYEYEVFEKLSKHIVQKQKDLADKNRHIEASLKAIKKINRGKNKDIDALCDED